MAETKTKKAGKRTKLSKQERLERQKENKERYGQVNDLKILAAAAKAQKEHEAKMHPPKESIDKRKVDPPKVSIDEGEVDPQDRVASDMQEGIVSTSGPLVSKEPKVDSQKVMSDIERGRLVYGTPFAKAQKKKSFLAGVVEFFKGIPAAIQSFFLGSSDSRKNRSALQDEWLSAPQDKELIKSSIAGVAPAIEEVLKDKRLASDIREKAEEVQEAAKQVGDEYSLNEFKMAVGELQELTKSFKDGYKDTAAYKLAHLSSAVGESLRDVSLIAAPADAPYASSAESVVDMKKQAREIGDASRSLKPKPKGQGKQVRKSQPKSQNRSKSSGSRSMSV